MQTMAPRLSAGFALTLFGALAFAPAQAAEALCIDCLVVRVGPPSVLRGPFPDELDAPFTAIKLPDGRFRGFTANGATYAVEGASLWDMGGQRHAVLEPPALDNPEVCGRWLTSATRSGDTVIGFVHQEAICDYGPGGQTDKSMAIATSADDGQTWTDLGTVITGADAPARGTTSGEGDCTMVDGRDGYFYGYCLRNTDSQTIVARAAITAPTVWHKYFEGDWSEPGLEGRATAIGFLGPASAYLLDFGEVATIATDPWFGGLRLSLSQDKITFADLDEPLLPIDGSDWNRPANTDLLAYATLMDPDTGSNAVAANFLLSYVFVPQGKGFESRYLVQHAVSMTVAEAPVPVQVGVALTRWADPARTSFVTSTGPLIGDRQAYRQDALVAYMLTRAPEGVASTKFEECSSVRSGQLDQVLIDDGICAAQGYVRERSAGWLYSAEQPGSVPIYRCVTATAATHFASNAADCEGLGTMEFLLGYGIAP